MGDGRLLSPDEALKIIFEGADDHDHLVGFATIRSTAARREPHVCAFAPALWSDALSICRIREANTEGLLFSPRRFHRRAAKKRDIRFEGRPIWFSAVKGNMAELRALFIDVDVGRPNDPDPRKRPSSSEAASLITEACRMGRLPAPTMLIHSGRGLYLVYVIAGDDGRSAEPATVAAVQTYLHIIDELCRRVVTLGVYVDEGASKRLPGWFKVPGTRDPKTGRIVSAHLMDQHPVRYTLDSLSAALLSSLGRNDSTIFLEDASEAYAVIDPERRRRSGSPIRRTAPGQAARPNVVRLNEIERIVYARGGHMDGHRHMTLFHYSAAVYRAHAVTVGHAEAKEIANHEARKLNATFTRPLLENEVEDALRSDWWIPSKNETVFSDLGVTMDEVESLALSSLIPAKLRSERNARRRYTTMSRKALRHTVETFRVNLLREGYSYKRIAEATGASEDTIKNLKTRTFGKRLLEKKQIDGSIWSDLEVRPDDDFDGDDGS